ncbi:MAG: hypothetical protein NTW21_10260 [Verrucomicrobia bacterium]|nr:hypothetical protein [Verrucomicrobiota bacterium]
MSEMQALAIVILLAVCAGFLLLLWLAVRRAGRGWRRVERLLEDLHGGSLPVVPAPPASAAGNASRGRAFETFLGEDPARRKLPKSEQFSAYRRWRREHGLNWSKP